MRVLKRFRLREEASEGTEKEIPEVAGYSEKNLGCIWEWMDEARVCNSSFRHGNGANSRLEPYIMLACLNPTAFQSQGI